MDSAAQPLSFGQILDRVYRLNREHLRSFLTIAAVPVVVFVLFFVAVLAGMFLVVRPDQLAHNRPPNSLALGGLFGVVTVAEIGIMVLFAIYQSAATNAALQADSGKRARFTEVYAAAWSKAGRYVWLMVLRALIVAGPIIVVVLLVSCAALIIATASGNPAANAMIAVVPAFVMAYVVGSIYAVFMLIKLSLAFPACVAEDLTAWTAIKRSNQLTQGAKGRIFLVGLVVYAAVYVAMMVCEVVFLIVGSAGSIPLMLMHANRVFEFIWLGVIGLLFICALFLVGGASWAIYAATFAVIYHDQRLRIDPKAASGAPA